MKNPAINLKKKVFNQFMSLHGGCYTYPNEENSSINRLAIPAPRSFRNTGLRIVRNV